MVQRTFLRNDGWFQPVTAGDIGVSTTTSTAFLNYLTGTATSTGNITITASTSTWTDGPSVAQGSSGVWLATGTVTVINNSGGTNSIGVVLWDGTTFVENSEVSLTNGFAGSVSLSGIIPSPAGNLRMSARATGASMTFFNASNFNADAITALGGMQRITAIRIG